MSTRFAWAALLLWPAIAAADGTLSLRGAYYKERSTRVIQPMIDAQLESSPEGTVDLHVLVDSITSASAAAGRTEPFTEMRYEVGVGYTHAVTRTLKLGILGRGSIEKDYSSYYAAGRAELELFQKNTTIGLVEGRGFDTITNGVATEDAAIGAPRLQESLHTGLTSVQLTQVLSPVLLGQLNYDFMDAHGYQANIYRIVFGGASPVPERVPDLRLRHAVYVGLRGFLPATRTTASIGYRYYVDDWDIMAHTPSIRIVQEIVPGLELRAHYRYYTQTAASFYQDTYTRDQIEDPNQYVTDDEKLSAFHTHTAGGQLSIALGLFGVTGTWGQARLETLVERIWQSNAFGDAWAGQVAVEMPFAY